jgi:hypothetical protein
LLFPYIATVGCFEQDPSVEPYTIQVSAPTIGIAVGQDAPVTVGVADARHEDYGGCGAAPELPTIGVDRVTCDGGCEVSDQHSTSFTVTASSAGIKRIDIWMSTSDGASSMQTVFVSFREPTKIDAVRHPTSTSGSRFGMFPGDTQEWGVGLADKDGPLYANICDLDVQGAGSIDVRGPCKGSPTAIPHALSSGFGTVTMRYRSIVRTEHITVIDPASIRSARLVQLAPSDWLYPIEAETPADDVADPLVIRFESWGCEPSHAYTVRFETNDGTIAYGGAQRLIVDPAGDDVGLTVKEESVFINLGKPVSGVIRGAFGPVALNARLAVVRGCMGAVEPPAPDASTDASDPDGGEEGGNDGGDLIDAGADAGDGGLDQ